MGVHGVIPVSGLGVVRSLNLYRPARFIWQLFSDNCQNLDGKSYLNKSIDNTVQVERVFRYFFFCSAVVSSKPQS
jgi:hypothetical protein